MTGAIIQYEQETFEPEEDEGDEEWIQPLK